MEGHNFMRNLNNCQFDNINLMQVIKDPTQFQATSGSSSGRQVDRDPGHGAQVPGLVPLCHDAGQGQQDPGRTSRHWRGLSCQRKFSCWRVCYFYDGIKQNYSLTSASGELRPHFCLWEAFKKIKIWNKLNNLNKVFFPAINLRECCLLNWWRQDKVLWFTTTGGVLPT